jgi:hypothetical protein
MKPTLPALFFLPFILLWSVECLVTRDLTCATLSNYIERGGRKSSLNRRSPFIADSFPEEASVNTFLPADVDKWNGWLTYGEPDPKVYGITLTRKVRGTITTVALKGWIHVVMNLPNHDGMYVASTISYLHK